MRLGNVTDILLPFVYTCKPSSKIQLIQTYSLTIFRPLFSSIYRTSQRVWNFQLQIVLITSLSHTQPSSHAPFKDHVGEMKAEAHKWEIAHPTNE